MRFSIDAESSHSQISRESPIEAAMIVPAVTRRLHRVCCPKKAGLI
jgi:hypothetical protein